MTSVEIALTFSFRYTVHASFPATPIPKDWRKRNKQYRLTVNWQASIYLPKPHQSGAPFASVRSFPKEQWYRAGVFFFLPSSSPLSFFRPRTYRKGYYFHCQKIKEGGYNNITNTNKVSPTQNTPALQASGNSYFYQGRLYWRRLLRRFLRSRTPRRFSFRLCTCSRFIWWTRPSIIIWKRLSSFYEDDLPWDFGGHWEDALWSSGGSLIRPQNGVIAVDTIFNLHTASIAIVTRETVLCHSLRPARPDIYVPRF